MHSRNGWLYPSLSIIYSIYQSSSDRMDGQVCLVTQGGRNGWIGRPMNALARKGGVCVCADRSLCVEVACFACHVPQLAEPRFVTCGFFSDGLPVRLSSLCCAGDGKLTDKQKGRTDRDGWTEMRCIACVWLNEQDCPVLVVERMNKIFVGCVLCPSS